MEWNKLFILLKHAPISSKIGETEWNVLFWTRQAEKLTDSARRVQFLIWKRWAEVQTLRTNPRV